MSSLKSVTHGSLVDIDVRFISIINSVIGPTNIGIFLLSLSFQIFPEAN